jgi:uncharacterized protein YndB with AHSA1/START domain
MARAVVARRIDFSPSLIWDALVDPDLVTGWLHPVETLLPPDVTTAETVEEPTDLVVDTTLFGRVEIRLAPAPGVARDLATDLELVAGPEVDAPFLPALTAVWIGRVDRLEDLLRGHPMDWTGWGPGPETPPTA